MIEATNEENVYTLVEQAMKAANAKNYLLAEQLLLRSYGTLDVRVLHNAEMRFRVLHLLANSYRDSGKLKVARQFYEKAKCILEEEHFAAAPLALCEDVYIQALCEGDLELALRSQQDLSSSLHRFGVQPVGTRLRNLLRLTALYWQKLKYYDAEHCLSEYIQLAVAHGKLSKRENVMQLGSLALLSFRSDKLTEAEELYKEALYLGNELQVFNHVEQAELLNQLGNALCAENKPDEAQSNCQRASKLREQQSHAGDESISGHFRAIADVYCNKGCMDEASRYCSAALDVFEFGCKTQSDNRIDMLALLLRRLGLYDDAELLTHQDCSKRGKDTALTAC